MLKRIDLKNVGPSPQLSVEFGERLNLLTGDNGLGKTFLLDVAWWILTGSWANEPAWPEPKWRAEPEIVGEFTGEDDPIRGVFSRSRQHWSSQWLESPYNSLAIYARVDEGFSVWDPAKTSSRSLSKAVEALLRNKIQDPYSALLNFTQQELWNGLEQAYDIPGDGGTRDFHKRGRIACNGLIRDWVEWSLKDRLSEFPMFDSLREVSEATFTRPGNGKNRTGRTDPSFLGRCSRNTNNNPSLWQHPRDLRFGRYETDSWTGVPSCLDVV